MIGGEGGRVGNQTAPVEGRRGLYLYLLPLVLVPLLLLGSAFLIIPSHWFEMRSGYAYLANLGYGARLAGRDCQVLVYGDSTALVGVDPAVIQAKTGLLTCNIAEFEGITLVSGTMPVDRFLERNPRPKFIVFLYAPENLSLPKEWEHVSTFEAISDRVEEERNWGTVVALATHPNSALTWAEQGLRMAALRMRTKPMAEEAAHVRERDGGQLKITAPALAGCGDEVREFAPDPRWLESLRARYGVAGTRVIVDATPAIDCDKGLPYYQAKIQGMVDDEPLPVYPVGDFLDEQGMRMHMNAKGAAKVSEMIADQVNAQVRSVQTPSMQGGR